METNYIRFYSATYFCLVFFVNIGKAIAVLLYFYPQVLLLFQKLLFRVTRNTRNISAINSGQVIPDYDSIRIDILIDELLGTHLDVNTTSLCQVPAGEGRCP